MTKAWLNGTILASAQAALPATDHGLLLGDGLFETFLVRNGGVRDLNLHLERLRTSCERMGIALPDDDPALAGAVRELVAELAIADARVRITVTSGDGPAGLRRGDGPATVLITAAPAHTGGRPLSAVTLPWRRNENSPISGMKTLSMTENVLAARSIDPADEGIWLNTRGEVCEGNTTNVFFDLGKGLVTPPLSSGCLPGVARAGVLARAVHWGIPVGEYALGGDILDDVRAGRVGMFLTSAVRGVAAVSTLDGHEVLRGRLTSRVEELVAGDDGLERL